MSLVQTKSLRNFVFLEKMKKHHTKYSTLPEDVLFNFLIQIKSKSFGRPIFDADTPYNFVPFRWFDLTEFPNGVWLGTTTQNI